MFTMKERYAEAVTSTYQRTHKLETRIVRIFNTYGPRMRINDGRAIPNFLYQALTGADLTVYGNGSQTRSFCYVSDLIDGIYSLALELDLHPNIQVELGISDDNASEEVWFAEFRFRVGDNRIPVASRLQWHDTEPFRARDMRDQTLVKVRRQNTIVVERSVVPTVSGGSIVITRVD